MVVIDRLSRASCLNCLVSSPADLDEHKSRTGLDKEAAKLCTATTNENLLFYTQAKHLLN